MSVPVSAMPPPLLKKNEIQRPGGPGTWNEVDATRADFTPAGVPLKDGPLSPPQMTTAMPAAPQTAGIQQAPQVTPPTLPMYTQGSAPVPTVPTGTYQPAATAALPQVLSNYTPGGAQAAPQISSNYQASQFSAPQITSSYTPGNVSAQTIAGQAPNYQAKSVSGGSIGGNQASAQMFDMDSYRPFVDAVLGESKRALDPRFASEEAAFRQRMVNQGIQEGTQAYDNAFANFSRSKNDAYSSASNQALLQALGAQNQMFGQSFQNASLAQQGQIASAQNALQAAGLNQADRQFGAQLGQQAQTQNQQALLQALGLSQADRQFGANLSQQGALANQSAALQSIGLNQADRQFGANLGLQGAQMGQQAQLANQAAFMQMFGLNQNQNQFDANLGFQGQRADMQDLMALLGYGSQATAFNNQALAQDQQRAGALFGLIPGLTPTQLDVMGPANSYLNAQAAQQAAAAQQQNGLFGALGQLGSAAIGLSDIRAKTDIQRVGTLDNGLPVYLYRYKGGDQFQMGVMAQEVEQINPAAVIEIGGLKHVNYLEAVK